MNTIEIVLAIIFLLIAYKIYKAIEKANDSYNNLGQQIKESLVSIASIKYSIDNLSSTPDKKVLDIFSKIPVNIEEFNKRKETLAKCYANYLFQSNNSTIIEGVWDTKPLSIDEAIIQANFEIDKFGIEHVLNEIKWESVFKNADSDKKFIKSDFFKSEIDNFWTVGDIKSGKKFVTPLDLFLHIYEFIKNDNYKKDDAAILNKRKDNDYYSYIANRAILHNLKKLGVIKFSEKENNDNQLDLPFKFISDDLDVIKKTINAGYIDTGYALSEDNKEYDEYLSEHPSSEELFKKI